jgi:uncharacterized protein YndB with AHSA1/START domain
MKMPGTITKENDGYKVVFHRRFNQPIDKVWDAITNPEQLRYWFTDIDMEFKVGGKMNIRFRDDDKTLSYGKIVAIEPPRRFVWTWEEELAEWELTPLDPNATQLTLTYSKLEESYAVKAPAGFHALLDRLEERLNGSEKLHEFGSEEKDPEHVKLQVHYTAIVYHVYPDLVKHKPVVVEKTYNASVDRVWKAITNKEQMKEWYFDLDEFKPEIGFHFKFPGQGHKGQSYVHHCVITDVIHEKKLQYSWQYEGYDGYSLVTFQLSKDHDKTRLILTHHGLETFPQGMDDFAWKSFNEGWSHITGISLPEFLEKEQVSSTK